MTARRAARGLRLPPAVLRPGVRLLGQRCLDAALPWPVQRARLNQLTRSARLPRGTTVDQQVIAGLRADVVCAPAAPRATAPARPADAGPAGPGTVVHFHGGGYCTGGPHLARAWAAHLSARTGWRVVLPAYRLAPENPYPAALDDARAVLKAVSGQTLSGEAAPGPLVLSGDSAGGGLALATVLALRDEGQEMPAGCILLSPWLDLGRDRRADPGLVRRDVLLNPDWLGACARAYAAPSAWADPLVSPLAAAHSGLPPLLIQAATDELVAPDAELLAASAAAAGTDVTYTRWPGLWHEFTLQAGMLAAADSAVGQAAWFLAQVAPG